MPTLAPPATAEWLEVTHTGKTEWRMSDSRLDVGSEGRVLGFVERLRRDRFEILWMTEPPRWAYVDSLELAIGAFRQDIGFAGTEVPEREDAPRARRGWRRWVR